MLKSIPIIITILFVLTSEVLTAGSITGKVQSAEEETPLRGATVMVVGEMLGSRTDNDGKFKIDNLEPGNYNIRATYTGYEAKTINVDITGSETVEVEFTLFEAAYVTKSIEAVASRAVFRETPVAFSTIPKEELEMKVGSRDLPMILNETPGVYATEQGGGAGDSRINIRGFDQRNVAVMINGVPVNDMENGWVYWSNWAGIGDATSSIQVQRGLGAGNIANPSVGGTMNIITDAANQKAGAKWKQEIGNDGFLKATVTANTGYLDNGLAVTVAGVRNVRDGVVDMTWNDAWAYYMGLSWDISDRHQIDFYVIGAPQQHGQRSFRESITTFNADYAQDLGISTADAANRGILFNTNWGYLDPSKQVDIYENGNIRDRRFDDRIMERENFYHKPQMNLNWYWQIANDLSLTNVFYLSTGQGGGSGIVFDRNFGVEDVLRDEATGQVAFNSIYDQNSSESAIDPNYHPNQKRAGTILRNSANNHFWIGYLGTFRQQIDKSLSLTYGLDARYYKGEHYQEVRSLIGGDYYIDFSNRNQASEVKFLGDKINFNNDGIVSWIGGFATGEYKLDDATIYVNTSILNSGYKRIDYFRQERTTNGSYLPGDWETDVENFIGYTIKTGANYNINKNLNVFGNVGYYSRPPIFRNVFSNFNTVYQNVSNEKVTSFEVGSSWWSKKFSVDFNAYYARWADRGWSTSDRLPETNEFIDYNLQGLNQVHLGVEFESTYKPFKWLRIKGMVSLGNFYYENDVVATYSPENSFEEFTTNLALNGIKVGDIAQKTFALAATFYPVKNSYLNITYRYFTDHNADFRPEDRVFDPLNDNVERTLSWKVPNYGLMDIHMGYTLPLGLPVELKLVGHIFNVLDEVYISDARDNFFGDAHNAESAGVWFGRPRTWNFGFELTY